MTRPFAIAAIALVPGFASAQTIVSDPRLEADAAQQITLAQQALTVAKQQLATLNAIQALLQAQSTRQLADAALAYAARQTAAQAAERNQEATAETENR